MRKNISEEEFKERLDKMRSLYLDKMEADDRLDKFPEYRERFFERFASAESKRSRMKRRMADLEYKRCQRKLDHKPYADLDEKLAAQKAFFKNRFMEAGTEIRLDEDDEKRNN